MDYNSKYLKYKEKYLALKKIAGLKNMSGGAPDAKAIYTPSVYSPLSYSIPTITPVYTPSYSTPTATPVFTPKASKDVDILTLIALNSLTESIRDVSKPKISYTPYIDSLYSKQSIPDVGDNYELKKDVTDYFYKKTLKWIKEDHEFSKLKKHLKFLKSKKGSEYISKLLKFFINANSVNWFDLRGDQYDNVKEYIRTKMASL